MRITESGLRRIIREEVQALREGPLSPRGMSPRHHAPMQAPPPAARPVGDEAMLVIPGIMDTADSIDMSVDEFVGMIETEIGAPHPGVRFESPGGGPAYSDADDTLTVVGTRRDLERFAYDLDEEMMGGAQSIADEDSFVNGIVDI